MRHRVHLTQIARFRLPLQRINDTAIIEEISEKPTPYLLKSIKRAMQLNG